ncbi:MAG: DUF2927 domain-containing protein [Clostridia bacterium]|nr:DUF2927 domain-containing protein [Clostridia bacterium]
MRTVTKALALLLLICVLASCNAAPADEPAADGTGDVTDYVDPMMPEDGGITVEGKSAGVVLDYFAEIAFGSEYGSAPEKLCRWEKPVVYKVTGEPTDKDLELIGTLCEKLNSIEGFPGISEAGIFDKANFEIMFISRGEIVEQFSDATEACVGMSEYRWLSDTCEIISARAAIDKAESEERASTVCEEFLQALGLAKDSYSHADSVFYQGKCVYSRPSVLDWAMVELLYHPALRGGMSKYEAITAAAGILSW